MNGGGAGPLEQDARRRGGGGAGACRAPAATSFFNYFLKNLLVPVGILKDPFIPGWSPRTKRRSFVFHH
jgi:hypothetical protein